MHTKVPYLSSDGANTSTADGVAGHVLEDDRRHYSRRLWRWTLSSIVDGRSSSRRHRVKASLAMAWWSHAFDAGKQPSRDDSFNKILEADLECSTSSSMEVIFGTKEELGDRRVDSPEGRRWWTISDVGSNRLYYIINVKTSSAVWARGAAVVGESSRRRSFAIDLHSLPGCPAMSYPPLSRQIQHACVALLRGRLVGLGSKVPPKPGSGGRAGFNNYKDI